MRFSNLLSLNKSLKLNIVHLFARDSRTFIAVRRIFSTITTSVEINKVSITCITIYRIIHVSKTFFTFIVSCIRRTYFEYHLFSCGKNIILTRHLISWDNIYSINKCLLHLSLPSVFEFLSALSVLFSYLFVLMYNSPLLYVIHRFLPF